MMIDRTIPHLQAAPAVVPAGWSTGYGYDRADAPDAEAPGVAIPERVRVCLNRLNPEIGCTTAAAGRYCDACVTSGRTAWWRHAGALPYRLAGETRTSVPGRSGVVLPCLNHIDPDLHCTETAGTSPYCDRCVAAGVDAPVWKRCAR